MMTWFSEKMFIYTRCICGFMPNLHKKSLFLSTIQGAYPIKRMYLFVKWKKGIVGGLLDQIGLILPFYQFLFFFHTKERDEDLF